MSEPQRVPAPGASSPAPAHDEPTDDLSLAELVQRAREHAEAEAAVAAVMRREDEKEATRVAKEHRKHHTPPIKAGLLLTLVLFNVYMWAGNPGWLHYQQPEMPSIDYYESSWKIAVFLQRQRIEEYRKEKGHIPETAQQAGQPVTGVRYTPIEARDYRLAAGAGPTQYVYHSTDSLSVLLGRTLLHMGMAAGGVR